MNESRTAALSRRTLAVLILLVAAWVLLHFIVHLAVAIATVVVVVFAVLAVVWAARVLL